MVFDNCQIDVFFHMRSHYNRLRSVHSIVDCSAPKGLRRLNQSSTSLQYAGMAPFCSSNSGVKSHNCKYNTTCIPVSSPGPKGCSPRAKSLPPRPGTRRHPDDMPFSRDMCSRSAKNPVRLQQDSTKTMPVRTGRQNPTPRHRPKMKIQHHIPAVSSVYYASKNTSSEGAKLESFHSRSDQDVRSNTSPTLTSVNQMPVSSSQYGEPKEHPKYNTPISTPPRKPSNVSARDHEYLQFLLKITEDIIQNDLYTNKEMKKVFVSHFNANKDRLDSNAVAKFKVYEPGDGKKNKNKNTLTKEIVTVRVPHILSGLCDLVIASPLLFLFILHGIPNGKYEKLVKRNLMREEVQTKDRMILQIHQLMQELNIPLSGDDEDQSPSWSEIESALKGLGIEEVKQKGDVESLRSSDSKFKSSPSPQKKCICLDLKNSDESSLNRRKMPEEEVENTNYDDFVPNNKFQSSLDRLTEHTEPISSQATCKASTVTSSSTFGQVDVLPGFESLETPRTVKSGLTEKASKPQSPEKSERRVTYQGPSRRKNTKKHKRRKKSKTSRIKRPKSILKDSTCSKCVEKVCQASIVAQSRGTDPHIKESSSDNVTTNDREKPLIITMKDGIDNQTDAHNLIPENAKNDYTLIKGPIYLLKTFLVENPNLVMKIETPSVPSLIVSKSSEANNKICSQPNEPKNEEHTEVKEKLLPKTLSKDEVNTESKVLKTDLDSTSGKYKEIRNILIQMTSDLSLSSSSSSFDSKETLIPFEQTGSALSTKTDMTIASKIVTTSAMHFPGLSITTPCKNQSKCSQFCSALTSKPNLSLSNNKLLMTDAYDLTPQRDNDVNTSHMGHLIGEDYNVSSILEHFLLTREIQTEDLHVEPTVVAFARMQKGELPGNSGTYPTNPGETSSTEEVTHILNSLGVNPGKSFSQNDSKIGKNIKSAKKDTSKGYHRDPAEADNVKSVTLRESVFSYPTSAPPPKKNSEIPDEVGQEFQMKMMFPFLQNPKLQVETPKADSDEAIAHTRRVSIMRNPIIQLPLGKVASDVDDSRKKAESIMKAVDVFKERQATKGPSHLSKAAQEMESSRESRLVEKMIHESKMVNEQPSTKPVSELLDLDTTSIDEVYAIGTEASSYVELPIKLAQRQGEQHDSTKGEDFIMDQSDKVEPSSSQIRRITLVTEKLDYLRNADDDDDYEISATLDQLALLLQQEQEKEEDIEIRDDSTPEEQSETSINRKYFRCCNFRRKKPVMPKKNIQEPSQRDSFSEKQYRSKSEAFEMALIALGQASSPTPETDPKASEKATGSELMEVSSAQSIVLALGGTKLPALKLGPQAEKNNEGEINIDFDVISTMALRVDDEKTARYKF